jgi:hypothetical protein
MQFGPFGSLVQLEPGSEGHVLLQAGLIQTSGDYWQIEIQPTPLLRSLFTSTPELEELYPLLVEFVMIFRYLDNPGFVDDREVALRLARLGMTDDGVTTLRVLVEEAEGRAWW